jgi:thiosulfate dehydrogenase [quinone] large subunit
MNFGARIVKALLRISLGFIFLWAFLDKLFGLGFSTLKNQSWLSGVSPTASFLEYATKGPLAGMFHLLAGSPIVDWLFMAGLFGVGICLMLGVAVRFSSVVGILMLFFMYLSLLLPATNPILDEHLIYILVLIYLMMTETGEFLGLGRWWKSTALVRRVPFLGNA